MNDGLFADKFKILSAKLNLDCHNPDLYYTAFVHPSYANEHNLSFDYERLEFLGDAVLDFLVGEYIYKNFALQEGEMTKLRAEYVCEAANSQYSLEAGLDTCLLVGKGAHNQKEDQKESVLGDLFEAFLGALYLDSGLNRAREFLAVFVFPKIKQRSGAFFIDYKSRLQEVIQARSKENLAYQLLLEIGPAHDKSFRFAVLHEGKILGKGDGKTKKEAEQMAAKAALEFLGEGCYDG